MNAEQTSIVRGCAALSASGKIHFRDVIQRLTAAGIERYHADYTRMETTYYTPQGGSCIVPLHHEPTPIGAAFSKEQIEAAVRKAQRGEIMYPEFTRLALEAGCVGYFVQITGQRVQYLGRKGEVHTEWFPGARTE